MRNVPSLVLLLATIVLALSACQSLDQMLEAAPRPTARVTGARLQTLTVEKAGLVFDVEVRNPYAVALPLVDLSYAIGSGGQRIAEGKVAAVGSIPASGSKTLQIPAAVEFRSLLAALKGVRPGSIVPYTAQIDLSVDAPVVGRMALPISHDGELPVPAIPEVALVAFVIDTLSLDRVAASARLRIRNTNQFDIALERIGLNLALGGKDVAQTGVASNARVAPGQSATIDVPVAFSPRALGAGVFSMLSGSEAGYALTGSLAANTGFGPLSLPIRASGRTPVSR